MKKAQSFHRLNHVDKICYLSGVPEAFLKVDDLDVSFQKITYSEHSGKVITIQPSKQKEVYNRLFDKDIITANMLVGLSSPLVEDNAMRAAVKLLKYALDKIPHTNFKVINLAKYESYESRQELYNDQMEYDILVIHGATAESTPERIQTCRDIVKMFEGTNRIVVTAGQDPKSFFSEKLRLTPSLVFFVNGADKAIKVG